MFLWDLAQTGIGWRQVTGFGPYVELRETDIGMAPDLDHSS